MSSDHKHHHHHRRTLSSSLSQARFGSGEGSARKFVSEADADSDEETIVGNEGQRQGGITKTMEVRLDSYEVGHGDAIGRAV